MQTTTNKTVRPRPPDELDGEARLEFHRICDELDAAGRLDPGDRAMIVVAASTWATWWRMAQVTANFGPLAKQLNGTCGASPQFAQQLALTKHMATLYAALGLKPASRARIPKKDDGPQAFDDDF